MATGRGSTAARPSPAPGAASEAPRRPSLALQPFAWGGLQILPVAPSAAESVAVIPPPLTGLYRTAPFRVSEYDERCRIAVAALEAALGLAGKEVNGADVASLHRPPGNDVDLDLDSDHPLDKEEDLSADLDLSCLHVPLPPGITPTFWSAGAGSLGRQTQRQEAPQVDLPNPPAGPQAGVGVTATAAAAVGAEAAEAFPAARAPTAAMAGAEGAEAATVAAAVDGAPAPYSGADGAGAGACGGFGTAVAAAGGGLGHMPSKLQDALPQGESAPPGPQPASNAGGKSQLPQQQGQEQPQGQQQEGDGRPPKRRRLVPVRFCEYSRLPPKPTRRSITAAKATVALAAAGVSAGAVADTTAEAEAKAGQQQQQQDHPSQPTPDANHQEGGKGGKAKGPSQQQQQKAVAGTAAAVTAAAGGGAPALAIDAAVACTIDGGGGGRGSFRAARGRRPSQRREQHQRQEQEQQQRQEQEQQQRQEQDQKEALAWWESMRGAAAQLESLAAVLQTAPSRAPTPPTPGAGEGVLGGVGEQEGGYQQQERELEEEMGLGERARRRMLAGEYDDPYDEGHEECGARSMRRRRRRGCTALGEALGGAYGTASNIDDGDGDGEDGRLYPLPAPVTAALERIKLAVSGPAQPAHAAGPPYVRLDSSSCVLPGGLTQEGKLVENCGGVQPEVEDLRDELVLWVAVCGPGQPQVLHEEFLVLGSQCLSELRDVLGCATEDAMRQAAAATQAAAAAAAPAAAAATRGRGRSHSRGRGGRQPAAAAAATAAALAAAASGGGGRGRGRRASRGRSNSGLVGSTESPLSSPHLDAAGGPIPAVAAVTEAVQQAAGVSGPVRGAAGEPDGSATATAAAVVAAAAAARGAGPGSQHGSGGSAVVAAAAEPSSPPPPSPPPLPFQGDLLPPSYGSYLFLEGRFYTDVRHPEAEDYSAPIRELCSAHGVRPTYLRPDRGWRPALVRHHGGGPLPPPAAMHLSCFADLTLRQSNHPTGVFCHRACCEHLLFVRDVRRWHPGDPTRRDAFPLRLRARDRAGAPITRRRCGLCEARYAELVTHDDPLAPSNPAIMCRYCFDLLHVGSNGERLTPNVVVQPYNPALDIATQGTWTASAGAWAAATAATAAAGGDGAGDAGVGGGVGAGGGEG